MNTHTPGYRKLLVAAIGATILLTACASPPRAPDGAANARIRLTQLQSDPQLASRASVEIRDAELAVQAAERPHEDWDYSTHLVVIADRRIDIADARAHARLYEDQRTELSEHIASARLDARTREANAANRDAANARNDAYTANRDASIARSDANEASRDASLAHSEADAANRDATIARSDADEANRDVSLAHSETDAANRDASLARSDADSARMDSEASRRETAELQRQISELNARETDRGLVVTLGDVLFETGRSELKGGAASNLDELAVFLNKYDDRNVSIEGHTDNVGSADSNYGLSQRRAESVKSYLLAQGVSPGRIAAAGMGENDPVADNESDTGRQQNRRVEVVISNVVVSSR